MTPKEIHRALHLLCPRFNVDSRHRASRGWPQTGNRMQFNSRLLPKHVDKLVKKIIARRDRSGLKNPIRWVDVTGDNLSYLQRTVKSRTMLYLLARGFRWNGWKKSKLPIFVFYFGHVIVWNGTHRTILSRLAGRRVRARVIDLDAFAAWCKRNPDESLWNVRVVKVRGKRRG